jgi:DNA-binding NarL/FixJ family response regulator
MAQGFQRHDRQASSGSGDAESGAHAPFSAWLHAVRLDREARAPTREAVATLESEETATEPRIRVLIAEDTYLVREALEQILDRIAGIEVVGVHDDLESVIAAIDDGTPDVVLTDIRMPPTGTDEGIRLAQKLRDTNPEIGVVVLSQYAQPSYALALLESGSAGRAYLLKERIGDPAQLASAIEAVATGGSVVDPKVVELLVQRQASSPPSQLAALTPREREVLAAIAEGKSNSAIAQSLVLTKRAVEKHINSIFAKLELAGADDVSRRVKAALMFLAGEDP